MDEKSIGGRYSGASKENYQNNRTQDTNSAESLFATLNYKSAWITAEADQEMVAFAEKTGEFMANKGLTSSKIRSIYGEIKRIQMGEFEKDKASFYLLKPKVAYALGRDKNNEGLKLFKLIFDKVSISVTDKNGYVNFCNLIEAILAYHKYFGGKD